MESRKSEEPIRGKRTEDEWLAMSIEQRAEAIRDQISKFEL